MVFEFSFTVDGIADRSLCRPFLTLPDDDAEWSHDEWISCSSRYCDVDFDIHPAHWSELIGWQFDLDCPAFEEGYFEFGDISLETSFVDYPDEY